MNSKKSCLQDAWKKVLKEFPFKGYIPEARKSSYMEMPKCVQKWTGKQGKILDFGAGACDKTAMLSYLGYSVTAYDDFADSWHNFEGNNKEKILRFAKQSGIIIEYLPNIHEFFQAVDYYFFPTVDTHGCVQVPLSVIEASSAGIPVITTPFGGLPYYFSENNSNLHFINSEEMTRLPEFISSLP